MRMEGMRQLIALHPRPDQAKSEEDLPFAPTVSTGPTTTTGGLVALQGVWRLTFAFGNREQEFREINERRYRVIEQTKNRIQQIGRQGPESRH